MFKTKAGKEYEGQLESLFQVNKILWRLTILLTIIVLILTTGYLKLKETVYVSVELPSKIYTNGNSKVTKGVGWASKSYFQLWAKSIVEDTSNFTIDNIGEKVSSLQKMMRPSIALKKDDEINKYAKGIINNRISQKFEILTEHVDDISPSHKQITYKGISRAVVGDKALKSKECEYVINLKIYENGVLYVEDFGTDCL